MIDEDGSDPELMEDVLEEKPKKKRKKKKKMKKGYYEKIKCPKCRHISWLDIEKLDEPRRIEVDCENCGQVLLITEVACKFMLKRKKLRDIPLIVF